MESDIPAKVEAILDAPIGAEVSQESGGRSRPVALQAEVVHIENDIPRSGIVRAHLQPDVLHGLVQRVGPQGRPGNLGIRFRIPGVRLV